MRALALLLLVACADPPRPPPRLPADPNAVDGCRSEPTALGGMHYTCTTYEVFDTVGGAVSIRTIEGKLVELARGKGIAAKTRFVDVAGADESLVIDYEKAGGHAFDLLVAVPAAEKRRVLQCQVAWFDNASTRATRQDTCAHTIGELLKRPAPPGREISAQCTEATARLPKLPGRVEPADDSEELRGVMRDFMARCTDNIAACAMQAKSYVEATLCRD